MFCGLRLEGLPPLAGSGFAQFHHASPSAIQRRGDAFQHLAGVHLFGKKLQAAAVKKL